MGAKASTGVSQETNAELEKLSDGAKNELQAELAKNQAELAKNQAELAKNQAELAKKDEIAKKDELQAQLAKNQAELAKKDAELAKNQAELEKLKRSLAAQAAAPAPAPAAASLNSAAATDDDTAAIVARIKMQAKTEAAEHHCTFIFIVVDVLLASPYAKPGAVMPQYHELRRTTRTCSSSGASPLARCSGGLSTRAHGEPPVDGKGVADPDGEQLAAIIKDIKSREKQPSLLWYDAYCMRRATRRRRRSAPTSPHALAGTHSPFFPFCVICAGWRVAPTWHRRECSAPPSLPHSLTRTRPLSASLPHPQINFLFLGTSVLVLLDLSFISRFWTQFESWLALQQPTTGGLRRARGVEKRETFVPIYNGTETAVRLLEEQWEGKSPLEAKAILAKPDVTVTNQSDKELQLVKLEELDGLVKRLNKGAESVLVLGIQRAVGSKPEGRSWREEWVDANMEKARMTELERTRADYEAGGANSIEQTTLRRRIYHPVEGRPRAGRARRPRRTPSSAPSRRRWRRRCASARTGTRRARTPCARRSPRKRGG